MTVHDWPTGVASVRARRRPGREAGARFTSVTRVTTHRVWLVINRTGRVHILVG
jgi:hypothetical protein